MDEVVERVLAGPVVAKRPRKGDVDDLLRLRVEREPPVEEQPVPQRRHGLVAGRDGDGRRHRRPGGENLVRDAVAEDEDFRIRSSLRADPDRAEHLGAEAGRRLPGVGAQRESDRQGGGEEREEREFGEEPFHVRTGNR